MPFDPLPHQPALPTFRRGGGPPLLLVHGFALRPRTYGSTASMLAMANTVLMPAWLEVRGPWTRDRALAGIVAALDEHVDEPVTVVAHSFGGALGLGLAARYPDRVRRLVLSDTLGLAPRWKLARSAATSLPLVRLATYRAAVDFLTSCRRLPLQVARAGWWGFVRDASDEIAAVAEASFPRHVLWAQRDTLLDADDGRRFAASLGASFDQVPTPPGAGPVDHDWLYRHPDLCLAMLHLVGVPTPLDDDAAANVLQQPGVGTPGA